MLAPLLFNIFLAAMRTVVLQLFSEELVILAELVHLKELPTSVGPESAMDYVRRAVWDMLYVDDTCTVSRSPQGLAKRMEVIVEVCRVFALTMSVKKQRSCTCLHGINCGQWCESKRPGKSTNRYNHSPT